MRTILAAALVALATTTTYAQPTEELTRMHDQMFSVSAQLNGNCSATLVWSDRDDKTGDVTTLLLTAKHCIKHKDREQTVDLPSYQSNRIVKRDSYVATVKAQHFKHDLALIELKDTQTFFDKVAKIAPADAELTFGEPMYVVGYPAGYRIAVTDGRFGGYETHNWPKDGTEYIRATPNVVGGNSGGGVYRVVDGNYELTAVVTGVFSGMWHMGLHTPIDAIHEFLKVSAPYVIGHEKKVAGASR